MGSRGLSRPGEGPGVWEGAVDKPGAGATPRVPAFGMRLGLTRSGKGAATPAPGLRLSWLPSGNRAVPEARREEGGPQHPRVAEQVLGLGAPYTPGSGRGNSPRMQMSGPEGMAVGTLPGSQGSPAAGTRTSPPWWPRDVLIETFYLFFFFFNVYFSVLLLQNTSYDQLLAVEPSLQECPGWCQGSAPVPQY